MQGRWKTRTSDAVWMFTYLMMSVSLLVPLVAFLEWNVKSKEERRKWIITFVQDMALHWLAFMTVNPDKLRQFFKWMIFLFVVFVWYIFTWRLCIWHFPTYSGFGEHGGGDRGVILGRSDNEAMIGLQAMQRANSTLEDFVCLYNSPKIEYCKSTGATIALSLLIIVLFGITNPLRSVYFGLYWHAALWK